MRSCPECRKEYADETLNYCLNDGARLPVKRTPAPVTVAFRPHRLFEFGSFRLDVAEKVLVKDGKMVALTPKVFLAVQILVENAGRLLEKDELMGFIWPDQFVEEGNLAYTIRLLRKALDDDAGSPQFIETVPRRGYRFIGEVRRADIGGASPAYPPVNPGPDNFLTDSRQGIYGPLIGRVTEIAEITDLLARDDVRLVTLTGIGGTGKTRLARETARQVKDGFSDGVLWVDLSAVLDPMLVTTEIVRALAIRETGADLTDAIAAHFHHRISLLILDNFEQVVSASVHLAHLLQAAPGLKMVVTSREPLKLRAEAEYQVPPLAVPTTGPNHTVSDLIGYEAVQLFIQRAERVRPDFRLTEDNAGAVSAICKRLDGLPLALELAAARTKVLSIPELLAKLENSLALLSGGSRDMPERQQTMRAAIEWSFGLLSDLEKRVFAELSVFEGGFTLKAAELILTNAAVDGSALSEADVVEAITSLTDKCLLRSQRLKGDEFRFGMLVVVRDFVTETLSQNSRSEVLSRAHAEYFLSLAETSVPHFFSLRSVEWLDQFELERDNITAAIRWSLENEPQLAIRILAAVRHATGLRWHTRDARYWMEEALKKVDGLPPELHCELLTGLGIVCQYQLDLARSRAIYEESLKVSLSVSDKTFTARSLRGLAAIAYMELDTVSADKLINEALAISRSINDQFGEAAAFSRLADIFNLEGGPFDSTRTDPAGN